MDTISPVRIARLPRRYRLHQPRGDRWIALCFLIGVTFWSGVWWVLR